MIENYSLQTQPTLLVQLSCHWRNVLPKEAAGRIRPTPSGSQHIFANFQDVGQRVTQVAEGIVLAALVQGHKAFHQAHRIRQEPRLFLGFVIALEAKVPSGASWLPRKCHQRFVKRHFLERPPWTVIQRGEFRPSLFGLSIFSRLLL